jgi:colanic acid/amylovoran biosynthesis glycosyltransferase
VAAAPPRLAYVTGTYPVLSETFVALELRELGRLGAAPALVAVVRGTDAPLDGAPAAADVVVDELGTGEQLVALARLLAGAPLRTLRALLSRAGRLGGSPRDVAALAPVALRLRAAGVAHVHAHFATQPATVGGRVAALLGVPWSFTAHAWDVFTAWEAMDEKLEACAFCVAVCEYNRRWIAERAPRFAGKIEVVVAGIDVEEFTRTRPYAPDGPVVAVGRLMPQKGFDVLVRAAALARGRIPEVVIAGEGPQRGALERLIAELGAPVRLAGALPYEGVRALYERASMAVLPCVVAPDGARDSMPLALKEAMALELPVVGTDEVAIPEMVGPDRGVLVPPGDAEALASALVLLSARSAGEREAMGRAGRAFVAERCNAAVETRRLAELFSRAARRPRA